MTTMACRIATLAASIAIRFTVNTEKFDMADRPETTHDILSRLRAKQPAGNCHLCRDDLMVWHRCANRGDCAWEAETRTQAADEIERLRERVRLLEAAAAR